MLTLDDLNRALAAWFEIAYHAHPHSETKQTPQHRYRAGSPFTRAVNLNAVLSFFHRHKECTVYEDFSDVRLEGSITPSTRNSAVIA